MLDDKDLLFVYLKDYELLRSEMRLYINKFYFVMTTAIAFLTIGSINKDSYIGVVAIIIVPYVMVYIIAYLSVITHTMQKIGGYIKILEERINFLFGTSNEKSFTSNISSSLPVLFWENYYFLIDYPKTVKDIFSNFGIISIIMLVLTVILVVQIIIIRGCISISNIWLSCAHYIFSSLSLILMFYILIKVNTQTSSNVKKLNIDLLSSYDSTPINKPSAETEQK